MYDEIQVSHAIFYQTAWLQRQKSYLQKKSKINKNLTCNFSISDSVKGCWHPTFFPSSLTTYCYGIKNHISKALKIYEATTSRNKTWRSKNKCMKQEYNENTHKLRRVPQNCSQLGMGSYEGFNLLKRRNNGYWHYSWSKENISLKAE